MTQDELRSGLYTTKVMGGWNHVHDPVYHGVDYALWNLVWIEICNNIHWARRHPGDWIRTEILREGLP
jgi:hypothetical protein